MASVQPAEAPAITTLASAPPELVNTRLRRLGEGVGKVVYASPHWVVKRERSPTEVVAIIVLWHVLRRVEGILPNWLRTRLFQGPSRQIRALRMMVQALMTILPRSVWFSTHIRDVWKLYYRRDVRGQRLADQHLSGTPLVPQRVTFPPITVRVSGWPGSLTVSEATERVEGTLHQRLLELAREREFNEVEQWLHRFLDLRQSGWRRGLFSVDAHLKNFGVCGDRLVLLDPGGLTDRWHEIEERLAFEEVVTQPHIQLGLGSALASRPDIAERFNNRWKAVVNPEMVRRHWPTAS